jgi:hypothetical protein
MIHFADLKEVSLIILDTRQERGVITRDGALESKNPLLKRD